MVDQTYSKNDEINIAELFAAIWSHKIFIVCITIIFIFLSGYQVAKIERTYSPKLPLKLTKIDLRVLVFPVSLVQLLHWQVLMQVLFQKVRFY